MVNRDSIPQDLQQLKRWVLWRAEGEKFTKVPYQPNGEKAISTNEKTWSSFEDVMNEYDDSNNIDGIGFVLSNDDDYCCVDIDGIEDFDMLDEVAEELLTMSYAEKSVSGNGLHIWFRHKVDKERHKSKNAETNYELYDRARYITFSGESLNDLPIAEGGERLNLLLDKVLKREEKRVPVTSKVHTQHNLAESDVLRIMFASKKGEEISKLMYGGWEEYYAGDYSDADLGLLNHLAYWTAKNAQMMDSIYRKSSLMRDKWDSRRGNGTYATEHIEKAINECVDVFEPEQKRGKWWHRNQNGTYTFKHNILAKEITKEFRIVRYPSAHGSLYFYNKKKGVYEEDLTNRQVAAIVRHYDDELKNSQVKEVVAYLQELSPIVKEINSNFIAVANGLLNLVNFEVIPFTSDYFVLQKISVAYKPQAYDPFVDSTLEKVTQGHRASRMNIEEMFAAVLSPEIVISKIFYLYGRSAANGKSSILNMIQETFNENGQNIAAVTPQKLATDKFAAASIQNKLAVINDDLPSSKIEDSGVLKSIVTSGWIEIERKGQQSETIKANVCFIIASNHLPDFSESGNSINRRLHIIPFEHSFLQDRDRKSDLETQRLIKSESAKEYVLKLAVDALKRIKGNPNPEKLTFNDRAQQLGRHFESHNDEYADYFEEYSVEYFEKLRGTKVYYQYERWCEENGVKSLGMKMFKELLSNRLGLEWKVKEVIENGKRITVRGFKQRK